MDAKDRTISKRVISIINCDTIFCGKHKKEKACIIKKNFEGKNLNKIPLLFVPDSFLGFGVWLKT